MVNQAFKTYLALGHRKDGLLSCSPPLTTFSLVGSVKPFTRSAYFLSAVAENTLRYLKESDHCCDKMMQKKELLASALACAFTLILGLQSKESDRRSKVGIFNLVNPVQFKSDSCTGSSNSSLTGYMGLYSIYIFISRILKQIMCKNKLKCDMCLNLEIPTPGSASRGSTAKTEAAPPSVPAPQVK